MLICLPPKVALRSKCAGTGKVPGMCLAGGRLITISFVVLRSLAGLFISGVSWFGFIFF